MFWSRFYDLCASVDKKPNQLCHDLQISSGVITKWKQTQALPNGESLVKIADYFGVSIDYLLGRTDKKDINR